MYAEILFLGAFIISGIRFVNGGKSAVTKRVKEEKYLITFRPDSDDFHFFVNNPREKPFLSSIRLHISDIR